MAKSIVTYAVFAVAIIMLSSSSAYALPISNTDLWDVSQGIIVTNNSPVLGPPYYASSYRSDIRNMFGGAFGTIEIGNTAFQDFQAAGTLHWVQWQTLNPISINAYNLLAAHDGSPRDANYRGISSFALYAWSGTSWTLLDQYSPSNPYGGGVTYIQSNYLELYDTFPTVIAQQFRAEFIQKGNGSNASGPRICELDGYYVQQGAVPEPATMVLLGIGTAAMAFTRKKKKIA